MLPVVVAYVNQPLWENVAFMTEHAHPTDASDGFRVAPAESADLEGMARCHIACFPEQFTSRMGLRYATAFYDAYLRGPGGIALVALDGAGWVVVGGRPAIRAEFLAAAKWRFLPTLLCKVLTHGSILASIARVALRKLHLARGVVVAIHDVAGAEPRWAVLQVIGVLPQVRGTPVAGRLIEVFRQACREAGFASMYLSVFTANARAIAFYRRHAWDVVRQEGSSTYMRCSTAGPGPAPGAAGGAATSS